MLFDASAKRVDPDQAAPIGAAWSGSTLFAYRLLKIQFSIVCYGNRIPCCMCLYKSSVNYIFIGSGIGNKYSFSSIRLVRFEL